MRRKLLEIPLVIHTPTYTTYLLGWLGVVVLVSDQESIVPHLFRVICAGRRRRRPRTLVDKKTLLIYVGGGGPLMCSRLNGDSAPIYADDAFSYRYVIT